MQNGTKFSGIPAGIFLKTFPEIPELEFPVALIYETVRFGTVSLHTVITYHS